MATLMDVFWRRLTLRLGADDGARAFVQCTWVTMFVAALAFVGQFGSSLPRADEYSHMAPLLTGQKDLSVETLWQQHNEYRWPLPKLLLFMMLKLTGNDFRSGMFACVIAMGGLTAALLLTVRRIRGRTSFADACFPFLILNWGHYENMLMATQLCYILPLCFACTILLIIASHRDGMSPRHAVLAGVCLIGLPLCGGSGVGLTPALAIWLVVEGVRCWNSPGRDRRTVGWVSGAFAASAMLLVVLYFIGYSRPSYHPPSPSVGAAIKHSLKCMTLGFGPGIKGMWPYSGAMVPLLLLAIVGVLLARWLRDPLERGRAAGMLFLMGAAGSVILGVGWARAGFGPQQAFSSRYCVFSIPIICSIYLSAQIYCRREYANFAQFVIFIISCMMIPLNTADGKTQGAFIASFMGKFERDLARGVPAAKLARYHGANIFMPGQEAYLSNLFIELSRAGIGRFRSLQPEDSCHEVPLPVVPKEVHEVRWEDGTARGIGRDPFLIFALPEPQFIHSVFIKYSHSNERGTPGVFQAFWKWQGRNDYSPAKRSVSLDLETGHHRALEVPVYDTIDRLRIDPDIVPFSFHIDDIRLSVRN